MRPMRRSSAAACHPKTSAKTTVGGLGFGACGLGPRGFCILKYMAGVRGGGDTTSLDADAFFFKTKRVHWGRKGLRGFRVYWLSAEATTSSWHE